MKQNPLIFLSMLLAITICLCPDPSVASEVATFQSFYHESSTLNWGITAVAAIAVGSAIYFSAGTATPFIASLGTSIGQLFGYSGIAATNYGLALLGGGSIASGGMGITGGVAVLAAALSFGSGVASDAVVGYATDKYSYEQLAELSKGMTTLPLPKNSSGSKIYQNSYEALKKVNNKEPISSPFNQEIIRKAINEMTQPLDSGDSNEEDAKSQSLLALLYFLTNDYKNAKHVAADILQRTPDEKSGRTVARFILATSSLYDEQLDFDQSCTLFDQAITEEQDNPLTPLLFAIYLDRMMLRMNDGSLNSTAIDKVYSISKNISYDKRKSTIQMGILNRYFITLWNDQEFIEALTSTENKLIRESQRTLKDVQNAMKNYDAVLQAAKSVIDDQWSEINTHNGWFDKLKRKAPITTWDEVWAQDLSQKKIRLQSYADKAPVLMSKVNKLAEYQNYHMHYSVIIALMAIALMVFLLKKRIWKSGSQVS